LLPEIAGSYFHTEHYLDGDVYEIETLDDYNGMINYHRDVTGLPVIVDFFGQTCGSIHLNLIIYW
jgi:hypothetical protein